ncbi:MAG: nucleotide exchange factor GrpE [Burkholderiales bacterium]|nr:MAG: nucleotide exchange factor GrpE [Betaproteobacteria bacterium]TAG84745.1 MAG: nucleotide exchange factor GrpE [Burkholderiales bacterium]
MANPDEQNTPTPESAADAMAAEAIAAANAAAETTIEEKLAAAEAQVAELTAQLKDQTLRSLAEQDNLRKRHSQEIANARDYAARDFAFSVLAVKDTLEMVLKDDKSTTEQLKMGVDMTLKNLASAFERAKVKEVKAEGAKFDPNVHQAMSQIESDQPSGTVLQVFQKGYMIGDRCLRPAMVAVATATKDDGAAPPAQA